MFLGFWHNHSQKSQTWKSLAANLDYKPTKIQNDIIITYINISFFQEAGKLEEGLYKIFLIEWGGTYRVLRVWNKDNGEIHNTVEGIKYELAGYLQTNWTVLTRAAQCLQMLPVIHAAVSFMKISAKNSLCIVRIWRDMKKGGCKNRTKCGVFHFY